MNPDGTRAVDRSWDQAETWRQMEEIYASGKVKAIGLCNWSIPYLEELKKTWKVVPAVNQVELHPFLPQHALREWCAKESILLEAYSPLGSTSKCLLPHPLQGQLGVQCWVESGAGNTVADSGLSDSPLLPDPEINAIANKYGVSPATVLISYHVNQGVVVLPKSVSPQRIIDNLKVIQLSKEDLSALNGMAAAGKAQRTNTPLFGWDLGFDDWYGPRK